ncbi:putative protein C19orf44 [Channa argus]|uniref:DUF4614 domain-containing protein n=1 Tax=Channa argus TaxID=215402 RepID=A0A6G1PMG3_CHAAH|nr:putative protein C19orf44 [Channa argus]KAK2907433.1 hypothetical protein Q8A73_008506 [Channa argus]
MWKRGGQSAALDRAQALLSAQRSRRGDERSTQGSPAKTQTHFVGTKSVSVKTRSTAPTTHTLFLDLSDVSSSSSAPEHIADKMGSAVPEKNHEGNSVSKDLRPQSSLRGGSRFLKKAPLSASSQSPVINSKILHVPERCVSSYQRGSQTAALNKLAQIESRFLSRKQPQELTRQGSKPAHNQTSYLGISPTPQAVTSVPLSAQSSSDQSLKRKSFLKNKATVSVGNTENAASGCPKGQDAGVRSWSRAASAVVPMVDIVTKSVRAASNVGLESDEEDMRKLLGDLSDSTDNSFLGPKKKKADKVLSKTSQRVPSTPSPAAVQPRSLSSIPAPHSPASPSRRSPFRFTGKPQAHFSPSALSPSPSPPCVSPSISRRLNSPHRAGSPQNSLSSTSGGCEVLSLEELFPVETGSEDLQSEMSVSSSGDFKINVMTLDDLAPATLGFEGAATPGKEKEQSRPVTGSPNTYQELPKYKENEKQQEEEEILDYQSDFESESRTERNYSASQVSEHLLGVGDEEEVALEVRDETLDAEWTDDDYSSTFSDTRRTCMSQRSNYSETSTSPSGRRESRSSVSRSGRTSSHQLESHASARRVFKEAAVQTQPDTMTHTWLTGMTTSSPALGPTYINSIPVAAHTLSAETVEALSTHNTAVFVLNEMLKQQLALTRRFIESSHHLHSRLVQSLEPPNYRYTKLDDTKEYIRKHRTPKLTMEEALKEVMQEMREYQCTVCD